VGEGNGMTALGLKIGAWSAAIIGAATILSWLYAFLVMQPVLAAVTEERLARTAADSTLFGRIQALAVSQSVVAAILNDTARRR
jgi:hypothetical protein